MISKEILGNFKLNVPLDASQIECFAPDQAVRVVARDSQGFFHSPTIKFNVEKQGIATFTFPENPGPLRVYMVQSNTPGSWNECSLACWCTSPPVGRQTAAAPP